MGCAMTADPAFGEVDLTNCDREPIHIPGAVQPHGLLLILHPRTLEILQIGGDQSLLPSLPLAGQSIGAVLPAAAFAVSCTRFLWTPICPRRDRNDDVQHEADRRSFGR